MKVFCFSTKPYDEAFLSRALADHPNIDMSFLPVKLTPETVPLAAGGDAVCCFVNDQLSEPVLEQLVNSGVRLVALRCAGFNNVDMSCAKRLGLTLCRVPEYSPYAVAEHAVALILDLNRNIHRAHNRIRENDYSLDGLMGFDLHQKSVGIIGFGKIGKAFAKIMQGFGCHLKIYDPMVTEEAVKEYGAMCDLATLFESSDVVSLHCPLTPETHHIIDDQAIAKMKNGVMLVNTSRGGLIDTPAVIRGLKNKTIGYLGIDVYEEEGDIFFEDLSNVAIDDDVFARLQTFPNVTITGHQAFFTREALTQIAKVTLSNIGHFAQGEFDAMFLVN